MCCASCADRKPDEGMWLLERLSDSADRLIGVAAASQRNYERRSGLTAFVNIHEDSRGPSVSYLYPSLLINLVLV